MALKMVDGKEVRVPGTEISSFWKRRFGALGKMDRLSWRAFRSLPLHDQHIMVGMGWAKKGNNEKAKESAICAFDILFRDSRYFDALRLAQKHDLPELELKAAQAYCRENLYDYFSWIPHPLIADIAKQYGFREFEIKAANWACMPRKYSIDELPADKLLQKAQFLKKHGVRDTELAFALWAHHRSDSQKDKDMIAKEHNILNQEIVDFYKEYYTVYLVYDLLTTHSNIAAIASKYGVREVELESAWKIHEIYMNEYHKISLTNPKLLAAWHLKMFRLVRIHRLGKELFHDEALKIYDFCLKGHLSLRDWLMDIILEECGISKSAFKVLLKSQL